MNAAVEFLAFGKPSLLPVTVVYERPLIKNHYKGEEKLLKSMSLQFSYFSEH